MAWTDKFKGKKEEEPNMAGDPNPEKKLPADEKPPEKSIADQIAEAVGPLRDKIGSLEGELEATRKRVPVNAPPEIPSVLDDENAAFNLRLTPIMARTFEMEARMVKNDIEREYRSIGLGDMWDQNRKEIDEFLDKSALVAQDEHGKAVPLRGDPNFVRNVADMVIGRAARKSGVRFDGKLNRFFLEDASGEDVLNRKRPLDSEGLTPKQMEAAKRFGIPLAEYKKSLSKLDVVQ